MTTLLVDTSVLIKWFHAEGESELPGARAIRDANQRGEVDTRVIELALYEVGNVLLTALHWPAAEIAGQLDDLVAICGAPLLLTPAWFREAASLGAAHQLTFYDAAWAASARGLGISLVSADISLLEAGLAESPTATAERLRLR